MRIGFGYDIHRLTEAKPGLTLGGIQIPFEKGFVAHSDGDVLIHALCDALLGALALGDIGHFFPDTDPKWKGQNSLYFLDTIFEEIRSQDYRIVNIDLTVIAERPKLKPYLQPMREMLSAHLYLAVTDISIKATTNEGCGEIGFGEAIAVHAVCLLEKGRLD